MGWLIRSILPLSRVSFMVWVLATPGWVGSVVP